MAKLKDTEINGNLAVDGDVIVNGNQVLDSNNVGSYALPITGGTLNGAVVVHTSGTADMAVRGDYGWFGLRSTGNYFGLYDHEKSVWLLYKDTNKDIYLYNGNGSIVLRTSAGYDVALANNVFYPSGSDGQVYLGAFAQRWNCVIALNGTIQTSDRNLKKNINELDDRYVGLFNKLIPVSYEFTRESSDRVHLGFIAQDVEEAMNDVGLSSMEFGGFCKDIKQEKNKETDKFEEVYDENGNPIYEYSLRYSEFIALNTHMIQKQQKEIESLKEENNKLKEDFNSLKEEIEALKKLIK